MNSEVRALQLLHDSPHVVLLVGHAGLAGRQRHVPVLVPRKAVLRHGVVAVGEEARRTAAAAGPAAVGRGVTDVGGVGGEEGLVEAAEEEEKLMPTQNTNTCDQGGVVWC